MKVNKTELVKFRVTPEEKRLFELASERFETSISAFTKETALRRISDAGIRLPVVTNPNQVEMFTK